MQIHVDLDGLLPENQGQGNLMPKYSFYSLNQGALAMLPLPLLSLEDRHSLS